MDNLDILMDKNNVTYSEANTNDLQRYINPLNVIVVLI